MPAPDIPADMLAFFGAEAEAIRWSVMGYERFCERYDLSQEDVYSHELWARYREMSRVVRQEWTLNLGGRL